MASKFEKVASISENAASILKNQASISKISASKTEKLVKLLILCKYLLECLQPQIESDLLKNDFQVFTAMEPHIALAISKCLFRRYFFVF